MRELDHHAPLNTVESLFTKPLTVKNLIPWLKLHQVCTHHVMRVDIFVDSLFFNTRLSHHLKLNFYFITLFQYSISLGKILNLVLARSILIFCLFVLIKYFFQPTTQLKHCQLILIKFLILSS